MRKAVVLLSVFVFIIIVLPAIVVLPYTHHKALDTNPKQKEEPETKHSVITVSVYRQASKTTEKVPLDQYLFGVVGSEMPADFQLEALKAQAIAARTYILSRIMADPAVRVTDMVGNQVYHSRAELKRIWGADYQWKAAKIAKAVSETEGEVVTYKGNLISPVFFSTSNGKTENAKDYWTTDVPYLRSVPSPWDRLSPKYKTEKTLALDDVEKALSVNLQNHSGDLGQVIKKTETGHVALYDIGGKQFTGRQIREKLNLSSTDFQLEQIGGEVRATTYGSGHDVGMSQYGAEGMARQGKNATQIITHYYRGTTITRMDTQDPNTFVKK
ncbi:stage II sporulation protein D [Sporolactobacillus sp. THM7-4]|nr:stage II sporulation protein D [Sporolactobacillus sp. THM7-4]